MKVIFPYNSLILGEFKERRVGPWHGLRTDYARTTRGRTDRPKSGKADSVFCRTPSNRRDNALASADGYLRGVPRIAVLGTKTASAVPRAGDFSSKSKNNYRETVRRGSFDPSATSGRRSNEVPSIPRPLDTSRYRER